MPSDRLERLLQLLGDSPGDTFLLFALAKEYEGRENLDQALHYYLELRQADPKYVGLYYHLGKLYVQTGKEQLAWDTYTSGMQIAKEVGDQHAFSELAGARLELGDEEDFG